MVLKKTKKCTQSGFLCPFKESIANQFYEILGWKWDWSRGVDVSIAQF